MDPSQGDFITLVISLVPILSHPPDPQTTSDLISVTTVSLGTPEFHTNEITLSACLCSDSFHPLWYLGDPSVL
jgi:hypothetical protein